MGKELGPPLDLDAFKGKAPNRVYRIGIELEGGWIKLPPGVQRLQHDGSVQIPREMGDPAFQVGELGIGPLTLEEWSKWLKVNYPQKVNASCGMHVHLQLATSLAYSRLMNPSYPATVIAYMSKWSKGEGLAKDHPIWPRLKGKSVYCQHLYMADEQIRNTGKDHNRERNGHRYTVINYCHGRYGTIECRLLPMMQTADQAQRIIQEFIDVTNGFLRATRRKETKRIIKQDVDDDGLRSNTIFEIPRNERVHRVRG
jgi:hypothetical protein